MIAPTYSELIQHPVGFVNPSTIREDIQEETVTYRMELAYRMRSHHPVNHPCDALPTLTMQIEIGRSKLLPRRRPI
jgi:hypothetical protein